jgi:hypothetical protein
MERPMDKAMSRLIIGTVVAALSPLFPTSGQAYGTADEQNTVLTKTTVAVKIAANTKRKKSAAVHDNSSAKGSVELLESLKKARKEKGGGK